MRYLIFSDIHGNLEALDAVLKLAENQKIDHYVCLGDLVGYGASPNEIIRVIRRLKPLSIIRGNHDKAVCAAIRSKRSTPSPPRPSAGPARP